MNNRIIICGQGSSGKDYLKIKFNQRGYKQSISYTTRLPRKGEFHGVDYYFITNEVFQDMIALDLFYEYKKFNGWYYGVGHHDFRHSNLFIMTPDAINELDEDTRRSSFVIYVNIDEDLRRSRLSKRNDADNVERRLLADYYMFKDFNNYDLMITNPDF